MDIVLDSARRPSTPTRELLDEIIGEHLSRRCRLNKLRQELRRGLCLGYPRDKLIRRRQAIGAFGNREAAIRVLTRRGVSPRARSTGLYDDQRRY